MDNFPFCKTIKYTFNNCSPDDMIKLRKYVQERTYSSSPLGYLIFNYNQNDITHINSDLTHIDEYILNTKNKK